MKDIRPLQSMQKFEGLHRQDNQLHREEMQKIYQSVNDLNIEFKVREALKNEPH